MANTYKNVLNNKAKTKKLAVKTPQTMVIPGREKDMVRNNAGGVVFDAGIWTQLDRFLVLGAEGGTYYVSEQKLSMDNAKNTITAIKADGLRTVSRIVEISKAGRAPKNDPALFALALALTQGDPVTKAAAGNAIPEVARIGTHLFALAQYIHGMRSWGRPVRRGIGVWYNGKKPLDLAMQMTKYANREGWTHADVIRLAHVKPANDTIESLFVNVLDKKTKELHIDDDVASFMAAVEEIKTFTETDVKKAVKLITDFRLPREVLPTQLLNEKAIWEALLPHMGMEAMIRNLATMTRAGLVAPNSDGTRLILEKMANEEAVKKSRLHPIKVLAALLTYKAGHGMRGQNVWTPVGAINAGLDDLFYATFQNIIPTGKRLIVALDISGSMGGGEVGGVLGLTPRLASAFLAMVTMRTEKMYEVVGFSHNLIRLDINGKQSLDQIESKISRLPFGGTDASLAMKWALTNKIPADAFLVYTDNETWAGDTHASQALNNYRQKTGIDAKFVVVAMTPSRYTVGDIKDPGTLDVVGFDTNTPSLMSDFVRGDF